MYILRSFIAVSDSISGVITRTPLVTLEMLKLRPGDGRGFELTAQKLPHLPDSKTTQSHA